MGGAEGVIDVHVGHRGQLLGELVLGLAELRVVLGGLVLDDLFFVEPQVLQQQDIAGLEGLGLRLGVRPDAVVGEDDLLAEQLGEPLGHRLEGVGVVPRAFGRPR